eukprot:s210_g16.t2
MKKKPCAPFGAAVRPFGRLPATPVANLVRQTDRDTTAEVGGEKLAVIPHGIGSIRRLWEQRCAEEEPLPQSAGSPLGTCHSDLAMSAAPAISQPGEAHASVSLSETSSAKTVAVGRLTEEPPFQEGPGPRDRPLWAERIYALPEFVQRRADTAQRRKATENSGRHFDFPPLSGIRWRTWGGLLTMADYELYEMDAPKRKRPPAVDILSFTVSRKHHQTMERRWSAQLPPRTFCGSIATNAYGQLDIHALMLRDHQRVSCYLAAIRLNKASIQNHLVLDVGAGCGILSMLAAKHGGAKHVYAVEAVPSMASLARRLVQRNGLEAQVTVLEGRIEEVELPQQMDVIISEWMGGLLFNAFRFVPWAKLSFTTWRPGRAAGIAFWFDVGFSGSSVTLKTDPGSPSTHWQQTVVYLGVFAAVDAGDILEAEVTMTQSESNPRQYDISIETHSGLHSEHTTFGCGNREEPGRRTRAMASNALAPISRLMARVWGNTENHAMKDAKVAFTKPKDAKELRRAWMLRFCCAIVSHIAFELHEPEKVNETEKPDRAPEKAARRPREVRIDATTMVPTDLYWNLLREGERAKNAGQHRLKDKRSSRGDSRSSNLFGALTPRVGFAQLQDSCFGQKKVIGRGRDSPNGREFYSHSPLQKLKWEVGPQCTQGIGGRKGIHDTSVPSKVGPGSYNIVASAAKSNSPLDGPEYCKTSLGRKLPSTLLPVDMCSPGPHHTYEVRKPLDAEQQNFNKLVAKSSRFPIKAHLIRRPSFRV